MTRAKPPVSPTTALVVVAILMLTLAVALLVSATACVCVCRAPSCPCVRRLQTCLRLPPLVGPPIRSSSLLHNGGEKKTAPHVDSLLSLTQIAAVGSVPLPGGPLLDAQHNIVDHSCVQFDVSEGMLTREAAAADLTANTSVSAEIEEDGYAYYQLCVAKHAHHHELIITLDSPQGAWDFRAPVCASVLCVCVCVRLREGRREIVRECVCVSLFQ